MTATTGAALAVVLVLTAFPVDAAVAGSDPDQIEHGKQVYRQQRCQVCHSIEGEGNRRHPLDGVGDRLTAHEIRTWIVAPREMDPNVRKRAYTLPAKDLDALVAYLRSLKDDAAASASSTRLVSAQAETAKVMILKLDYAQAILRSIVMEEFAQLERQSRELAKLTETAGWHVLQTSDYRRHSAEFLRIAESLAAAARDRNADAAALDYVALTLQCITCHKHVRGARLASRTPFRP